MFEHDRNGLEQDLEIQLYAPGLDILSVKLHDLFEVSDVASSADLPQTGDPGLDAHSHAVVKVIFFP